MVSMKCTIFLRIIFIVWQACCYAFTPRNTASPITFALNNGIPTTDIPGGDIEMKKSRLVWLTGHEDLRLHDHGGFNNALKMAAERDEIVIPVFIIDTKVHLRSQSHVALRRLHHCLSSLERDILSLSLASPLLSQLVVRTGSSSWVLPALAQETNAVACHCVADDVVSSMRSMQRSACEHLIEMEIDVLRWSTTIRPDDSFRNSAKQTMLPSYFPDYCQIVNKLPTIRPDDSFHNVLPKCDSGVNQISSIKTDGIPTSYELIRMAEAVTPVSVLDASKQQHCNTYEPYEEITSERWLTEIGAKKALEEYCNNGNDEFTDKHFISSDAANIGSDSKSMYASSVARIVKNHMPSDVLAQREGPTRAFSPALSLGALSSREVLDTARNRSPVTPPILWWDGKADSHSTSDDDNNRAGLYPSDSSVWGRSSEGCLSDVIEWREWYFLLAQRSLALQERGEPATSGAERIKPNQNAGDPREFGHVNYWRFKNQYLVRYLTWSAGKDYYTQAEETRIPALLLVHGFAASAEQYERLVYSIRQQTIKSNNGKDVTPPIFAMDLLGFGHAEKPGLTFTQYLWESQIIDFAVEVMEATPMVMVRKNSGVLFDRKSLPCNIILKKCFSFIFVNFKCCSGWEFNWRRISSWCCFFPRWNLSWFSFVQYCWDSNRSRGLRRVSYR